MPSAVGARVVVSGKEAVADVRESVRVDRRDGSVAIVYMALLLQRPQIETFVCFPESSICSMAIFRVPRHLPHRRVPLTTGRPLRAGPKAGEAGPKDTLELVIDHADPWE